MTRLRGINLKGLNIFPSTIKTLKACTHKYGCVATWSHCTDRCLDGSRENAEINGFKSNLALTSFVSPVYPGDDMLNIYKTGRIDFGIYLQTDYWYNPVSKVMEWIPDFYGTTWSQASKDAGLIIQGLVGTAKPERYPNHGQEMYNLTNGLYGYDVINGIPGAIDVLTPLLQWNVGWYHGVLGRYPSNGSYGYGRENPAYKVYDYFLSFRNSGYNYGNDYDFTHLEGISRQTTTRSGDLDADFGITRAEAISRCQTYLENAIQAGGWYTDFSHWHTSPDTELQEYYASQRTTIGSRDIAIVDFGTAIEYQFLKKMVRRISLYSTNGKIVIAVDTKNNDSLKLDCIKTSLSVDVDLTGTILQGKEIKGCGIRKLGLNHFIVEVPYFQKDGFQSVTLEETLTPSYSDFTIPSIVSAVKSGNTLTVVTDKPTNLVLFTTALGGALYTASVLKRDSTMTTTHTVDVTGVSFASLDTYIGVITSEKQSILSAKYNF